VWDLAKNVIQVHAVDAADRRVVARSIKRDQFVAWCAQLPAGCLVAMEAVRARITLRAAARDGAGCAFDRASFVSPYAWRARAARTT